MKKLTYVSIALACLIAIPAPAENKPKVEFKVLAQSDESWDGSDLPAYPKKRPEITVQKVIIPPKGIVPWHKHPTILACYVITGKLSVVAADGDKLEISTGDAFIELVEKWHMGRNDGETTAELVVFYAGAKGLPHTIAKLKP